MGRNRGLPRKISFCFTKYFLPTTESGVGIFTRLLFGVSYLCWISKLLKENYVWNWAAKIDILHCLYSNTLINFHVVYSKCKSGSAPKNQLFYNLQSPDNIFVLLATLFNIYFILQLGFWDCVSKNQFIAVWIWNR